MSKLLKAPWFYKQCRYDVYRKVLRFDVVVYVTSLQIEHL